MSHARLLAMVIVLIGLAGAGNPAVAQHKLGYMATFTDAERAKPHVQSPSLPMPDDFVDGQWQGIIAASDGNTYFAVSSHSRDRNGQFYRYLPSKEGLGRVEHLIDIGKWCGETDTLGKTNTQGKIHSEIYELDGKLYMSTTNAHADYPYKGGHFLSYDLKTGKADDLGVYPDTNGGLLTMHLEPVYRRLYAISQTNAKLVYYDLEKKTIVTVGSVEESPHQCRHLISDARGNVFGSTWGGVVYRFDPRTNKTTRFATKLPHDPDAPQPAVDEKSLYWQATHWAAKAWDEKTKWWYMTRGNDEYLFRLRLPDKDGDEIAVEGLAPFGFRPSKVDQPRFAAGALVLRDRVLWGISYPVWKSQAHLMSYDIDKRVVTDHGPLITDNGRRVSEIHSMVLGSDRKLHAVAMVWSIEGKDAAQPWADRASCFFHPRLMVIDVERDAKK